MTEEFTGLSGKNLLDLGLFDPGNPQRRWNLLLPFFFLFQLPCPQALLKDLLQVRFEFVLAHLLFGLFDLRGPWLDSELLCLVGLEILKALFDQFFFEVLLRDLFVVELLFEQALLAW